MFLDVFFSAEETIDLLPCNKCDSRVTFFKFLVSRLELSQLIRTVRSPRAADEHQHQRPSAVVGKPHNRSISCRDLKGWCRIAHL